MSSIARWKASSEEGAQLAMAYLDRDPILKSLKEKDLYVQLPYLDQGGLKSADLVRSQAFPATRMSY